MVPPRILRRHDITFQRTETWLESNDPGCDAGMSSWTISPFTKAPAYSRLGSLQQRRVVLHPDLLAAQGRERARIRAGKATTGVERSHKPHDPRARTFVTTALLILSVCYNKLR